MNVNITIGGKARAGFRSIAPRQSSLRAAINRLASDGHLGARKCIVTAGFAPLVQKGRVVGRKGSLSEKVAARQHSRHPYTGVGGAMQTLATASPQHAWLEVPPHLLADAREIVSELMPE